MSDDGRQPVIILVLILGIAGALRIVGIDHGLPFFLRSNEEELVASALKMIELRIPFPVMEYEIMKILIYPPVMTYLVLLTVVPILGLQYLTSGMPPISAFGVTVFESLDLIFLVSRIAVAAISVATVWVVYRIGTELFRNQIAACAAALFVATDFVSAFSAHFIRHWSLTTFFVWAAALIAIHLARTGRLNCYLMLAVCAGMAFGTGYIGGMAIVFGLIAHFRYHRTFRILDRNFVAMGCLFALIVAAMVAIHPYAAIRLTVGEMGVVHHAPKSVLGFLDDIVSYALALWRGNPALVLAALGGLFLAIKQRDKVLLIAAASIFLGTFLTLYLSLRFEGRYAIVLAPALGLMGGYAFKYLSPLGGSWSLGKISTLLIGIALLGLPAASMAQIDLMLARNDTRVQALHWLADNTIPEAQVLWEVHHVGPSATREALSRQAAIDPLSLRAVDRYSLARMQDGKNPPTGYLGKRFDVLNVSQFAEAGQAWLQSDLTIESILAFGYSIYAVQTRPDRPEPPLRQRIREIVDPIAVFRPTSGDVLPPYLHSTVFLEYSTLEFFGMERFGPVVEIYLLDPSALMKTKPAIDQ